MKKKMFTVNNLKNKQMKHEEVGIFENTFRTSNLYHLRSVTSQGFGEVFKTENTVSFV